MNMCVSHCVLHRKALKGFYRFFGHPHTHLRASKLSGSKSEEKSILLWHTETNTALIVHNFNTTFQRSGGGANRSLEQQSQLGSKPIAPETRRAHVHISTAKCASNYYKRRDCTRFLWPARNCLKDALETKVWVCTNPAPSAIPAISNNVVVRRPARSWVLIFLSQVPADFFLLRPLSLFLFISVRWVGDSRSLGFNRN